MNSEQLARVQAELDEQAAGPHDEASVKADLRGIDRVEYDRQRKALADGYGIRAETLDKLFKEVHRDDEAGDGALAIADVEPWPEPVDGRDLLNAIVEALRAHMVMPDGAVEAVALWVLHTYAYASAYVSPLLAITSPEKRCGKTTLQTLLQALVARPLSASNITPAALFRSIEKWRPTLLIDEADTFMRNSDDLRGIINSGHSRATAHVVRTVGDNHEPTSFSTWAPKAIALIGKLHGTLADRSVHIELRRRLPGDVVERVRLDRLEQFKRIQRQAARWAQDMEGDLRHADPEIPDTLHDRAADNWRHLLAIADAVGFGEQARTIAVRLQGPVEDDSAGVQLLDDMATLFSRHGPKLTTARLLDDLHHMEDRPWPEWRSGKPITARQVVRLLKGYGIRPKQVRVGETAGVSGYRREDFEDAFARYLPSQSSTPLQPSDHAASSGFQSSTPDHPVENEGSPKGPSDGDCRTVEDKSALHREAL